MPRKQAGHRPEMHFSHQQNRGKTEIKPLMAYNSKLGQSLLNSGTSEQISTFKAACCPRFMTVANNDKNPASYEEAVAELEQLVAKMEAGELSLEQSIDAYRRGADLIRFCTAKLDKVEKQVKVLDGKILKPFQTDTTDEAGQ